MPSEEVELNLEFSNDELANFLENFSQKLREGDIGLSFRGRDELQIEPNKENEIELSFSESGSEKELEMDIKLRQDDFNYTDEEGRKKINVVVEE